MYTKKKKIWYDEPCHPKIDIVYGEPVYKKIKIFYDEPCNCDEKFYISNKIDKKKIQEIICK